MISESPTGQITQKDEDTKTITTCRSKTVCASKWKRVERPIQCRTPACVCCKESASRSAYRITIRLSSLFRCCLSVICLSRPSLPAQQKNNDESSDRTERTKQNTPKSKEKKIQKNAKHFVQQVCQSIQRKRTRQDSSLFALS